MKLVESKTLALALQKHKGNQSATAKEVGITRQAVKDRIKKDPIVKSAWEKYIASLKRIGATDTKSARVLSEAMDAVTIRFFTGKDGKRVEIREPDHMTRLKAVEQYLKIMRLIGLPSKEEQKQQEREDLENMKTQDLCNELKKQYKFLTGKDMEGNTT